MGSNPAASWDFFFNFPFKLAFRFNIQCPHLGPSRSFISIYDVKVLKDGFLGVLLGVKPETKNSFDALLSS